MLLQRNLALTIIPSAWRSRVVITLPERCTYNPVITWPGYFYPGPPSELRRTARAGLVGVVGLRPECFNAATAGLNTLFKEACMDDSRVRPQPVAVDHGST